MFAGNSMAGRSPRVAVLFTTSCLIGLAHGATAPDSLSSRPGGIERVNAFVAEAIARKEWPEVMTAFHHGR
jgi:hypothetical protein